MSSIEIKEGGCLKLTGNASITIDGVEMTGKGMSGYLKCRGSGIEGPISFGGVSDSAERNPWFEREFKRGYDDAKRQFNSPYQQGYRKAMKEIERQEAIRESIENPSYFL